jgi:hypothetical protein
VWGRIDELLQQHPAGLTEFYEPEDIFQQVMMDSSYEVWVVVEQGCIVAASIWCLARYPKKSVYSCYWLGGTGLRKHYHHTMETLLSYCKACHIDELAFNGRKGWALLLAPWDFKLSVRLTKDVRMKWRH